MMRKMWVYAVGVLVIAGIGIAAAKFYRGGTGPTVASTPPIAQAASATKTAAMPAKVDIPEPKGHFDDIKVTDDDHILGKKDAPVTVIEYASLTCPHCAHFANDVLPKIRKTYIDTGKVRLVYRDFPLDRVALTASMIARCAGPGRYFGFVEAFFASQENWVRESNPVEGLARIARVGGVSEAEFNACLKNQKVADAVVQQRLEAEKTFNVNSTPTLIIGGDEYTGALSFEQFSAIVDRKLGKS